MATIYLTQSSKTDANGESEILIRFSHGKINQRAKTNIFLSSQYWNDTDQKIDIPKIRLLTDEKKKLIDDLNAEKKRLNDLTSAVLKSFNDADKNNISSDWLTLIVDKINFPEKHEPQTDETKLQSFFETFDEFLLKHPLSVGRKRHFDVVVRALKRFELYTAKTTKKAFDLKLDTITPDLIRSFSEFLKNECEIFKTYPKIYEQVPETRNPKPRGQNTVNGMLTKLRTFLIWSVDNEKTTNNPFRKYSIDECVYGTPYYITIEERNKLYHTDLSKQPFLETQRDIFVFQCLIGCRVSDLYDFTKQNIINGAIEYIARKTIDGNPVTVRVPLNSIATEILAKYASYEGSSLFPFTFKQEYNEAIKAVFAMAELTRPVTILDPLTRESVIRPLNEIASSHLARRCFVGNLYKKVKDPNLVGALSGHKEGSRAFARYREIDEGIKKELVKMLE
jgi:site-specific recombinase XerD